MKSYLVRVVFPGGHFGNLGTDARSKNEARKIIRDSLPVRLERDAHGRVVKYAVKIGRAWEIQRH